MKQPAAEEHFADYQQAKTRCTADCSQKARHRLT